MRAWRTRPRSANARHHAEWLRLIDVSGPFLSLPVLDRVFPQELDAHDPGRSAELRVLYEEWQETKTDPGLHRSWVLSILAKTLQLPIALIVGPEAWPDGLEVRVAQHHETLRPDLVLMNPTGRSDAGKPRLLVHILSPDQNLDKPLQDAEWKASPATRMTELLRGVAPEGVRLGLVTNGEQWMLVHAPRGETAGYATWQAALWLDEPVTLRALRSLLGVRRFFGVPDAETLEALYAASAQDQQDVTDRLGLQVRRAVTILVQAIDQIDKDRNRTLLAGFDEKQLYEAAVTTMMRLVFLLYAEERRLLPIDASFYGESYAVSTLLEQLQDDEDTLGEQVLERRHAAWNRLLATFRAVHGGVDHEAMRLPPYGGGLFDPDRFPFLEGRKRGSRWREAPAQPLPIDDATVLDLLMSLQFLEVRGLSGEGAEAQRLSFKALGVEEIGHVYESLLDHTAARASTAMLGLGGPEEPEIPLDELEARRKKGKKEVLEYLAAATGKPTRVAERALEYEIPEGDAKWLVSCGNDSGLLDRVSPWAGLVREDHAGMPVVIEPGSVYVTKGSDRRSTGTHYTPPSLTEPIVRYTLEPLVYEGPTEGRPEEEWVLRSSQEILGLKVCDISCGSGAFLVQACRYLSERLVEAWAHAEARNPGKVVVTPEGELSEAWPNECIVPRDPTERLAVARRLVADRCLYGVDVNPMAVEMAKLSVWLVTLQKGRPFNFVDHAIKCGDSLLGVTAIRQIEDFTLAPGQQSGYLFLAGACRRALQEAEVSRRQLEAFGVLDIRDAFEKERLLKQAELAVDTVRIVGDLLLSLALAGARSRKDEKRPSRDEIERLLQEAFDASIAADIRHARLQRLAKLAFPMITRPRTSPQRSFHWPLEFPEAMTENGGFDAVVGNPPFLGGQRITGHLGSMYRDYLVQHIAGGQRGSADLCAYFFLRASTLVRDGGMVGLVATNTISQGDTRDVGLRQVVRRGSTILRATSSDRWPGKAALEVSHVWLRRGTWGGLFRLDHRTVPGISDSLTSQGPKRPGPHRLMENRLKAFKGVEVNGLGFLIGRDLAEILVAEDDKNLNVVQPFLNGEDVTTSPELRPSRYVINFRNWPEAKAREYSACWDIVRKEVQPFRARSKVRALRERWWQFKRPAVELQAATRNLSRVIVTPMISKYSVFGFVPRDVVAGHTTIVFAYDDHPALAVLQSCVHERWVWEHMSTFETRKIYVIDECFETFPFPRDRSALQEIGRQYDAWRNSIMNSLQEGLTKIYNRLNNCEEQLKPIRTLRDLHVEMDTAVVRAYDWSDLTLGHGFRETKEGTRFTIDEAARNEILQRLLELNRVRCVERAEGTRSGRAITRRVSSRNASGNTAMIENCE
jgi:hypothetical protein